MNNEKIICTDDFNIAAASMLIAIRSKKSNTMLVLAELIRLSEDGVVYKSSKLHWHFEEHFDISYKNYISIIAKLGRLKVLRRGTNSIVLCDELKSVSKLSISLDNK